MAYVLIVDDHPDVRDVFGQLLEMHGHKVLMCPSGEEALELLKNSRPDAIIADLRLPQMSGIELLRSIRQSPQLGDIPVIICSADDSTRQEVEAAGAADFWLKGSDLFFESVERFGTQLK